MPWHEFVDARLWPAAHQAGEQVGEVGLQLDAVQLAGLDQGGDGVIKTAFVKQFYPLEAYFSD